MKKPAVNNISRVVEKRWCTGCGTCTAFCPTEALGMGHVERGGYVPVLDEERCTQCGLCVELCPAANENFKELNKFVFGEVPDDVLLGNVSNCYTGYSADAEVRYRATSGGAITSLLLFLLREKMIDGAVLTRLKKDDPLAAEPFIARSEEEILSGMGSKYVPVPVNTILKTVLAEEGKFAIVALPCHLHGIRRAEMKIEGLQEKLVFHFGLTCSHTMTLRGVEFVLDKAGVSTSEIVELKYRGNGWPGGLRILLKDGEEKFIENMKSWWSEIFGGLFFTPYYCSLCCDHLGELADVSFADAWLRDVMRSDKVGTSIIVARSRAGQDLVDKAISSDVICVEHLSNKQAIRSQIAPVLFKKRNIRARMNILKAFGRELPETLNENRKTFLKPTVADYLVVPLIYCNLSAGTNRLLRAVLKYVPFFILRSYRQVFRRMFVFGKAQLFARYSENE